MELHAFHWEAPVAQTHDRAAAVLLGGPGADFQFCGQIIFLDDERVIAGGGHRHGKPLKDSFVVVHHGASLAMHEMSGTHDGTAEGFADRLVSEADSEHRNLSCEVADQIDAD